MDINRVVEWAPSDLFGQDDDGEPITPAKILAVKYLIRRFLPIELAPTIVFHADLFVPLTRSKEEVESVYSRGPEVSLIYLWSAKVQGSPAIKYPVRRIRFKVVSCDQGWSSHPEEQNTRENASSWFSVVKESELSRTVVPPKSGDSEPSLTVYTIPQATAEVKDDYDPLEKEKHQLFTNIHAGEEWETSEIVWQDCDFVWNLEAGDRVGLVAKARRYGWENSIKSASITLECAW